MRFSASEHRSERNVVCRAPAAMKLGFTVILLVGTSLLPRTVDGLYWIPAIAVGFLWLLSRVPLRHGLRRLLVAEFFILGIAGMSLLSPATAPAFFSALLKSNLCIAALIFLNWSTPFSELLAVMRRSGFPALMLTTLALMSRYLPLLGEESRRMQRARQCRTYSARRTVAWATLGTVIGRLFTRSVDRAERIYLAMCARGWR